MVTLLAAFALGQQKDIVNDDRDVIQTAMLSFFHHEPWHAYDWKPDKYVVLATEFNGEARPDYRESLIEVRSNLADHRARLQEAIKDASQTDANLSTIKAELQFVTKSQKSLNQLPQLVTIRSSYTPPTFATIKSMKWDDRINITGLYRPTFETRNMDNLGEKNTVYAFPARPTFSPDGQEAIVDFTIPWAVHNSHVWFVLKRSAKSWKIIAAAYLFIV